MTKGKTYAVSVRRLSTMAMASHSFLIILHSRGFRIS
jgi:hypothetical protein